MPLREDAVKVAHRQVFIKSHILGISPSEALELAARIVSAANQANTPVYVPGAIYQDADGDLFIRNYDNHGWRDDRNEFFNEFFPTSPLVRLVPESEVN